jgi:predicted DNA-binding transcriptional regulator YafY
MSDELTEAAAQLRRLLLALPALEGGKAYRIDEIAAKVGANVDTVARDLRTLVTRTGDEPGGFFERIQLGFDADTVQLQSNVLKYPMALSPTELRAIELGLDVLAREVHPEEAILVERARARVREATVVMPRSSRTSEDANVDGNTDRAASFESDAVSPTHLAAVRDALARGCKAFIRYNAADSEGTTERTVRPYGLIFTRGHWFLVAFCQMREDIRVFRVDRISDLRVLPEEKSVIPDDFSLDEIVRHGRVLASEASESMRVRYSPAIARWIAELETGDWNVDGSFEVAHPLLDDQWAVRHVLQYGRDAEVLAPARIRTAIRARLASIVA